MPNFVDVLGEQPNSGFVDVLREAPRQWEASDIPIVEEGSPTQEQALSTWQDLQQAVRAGMVESPTGAVLYGEQEPYAPKTTVGEVGKIVSNLAQTIPYYMAGAGVGTLATPLLAGSFGGVPEAVAPWAATMGAFAFPRVVEEVAKQFHSGQLSYDDLVQSVGEELAKAIAFHKSGDIGGKLFKPLGKVAEQAGRIGLEGTSLAFLANPGKRPTGKDIMESVATLAGLGVAGVTGTKLLRLAVKGVDTNKFTELVKEGVIDKKTAEKVVKGETPKELGSIWERMPDAMLRENAKQGIPEAQREWKKRLEEKRKAKQEEVPQEGAKPLEHLRESKKRTRSKTYLSKTSEYKKLLGKKAYYEVLEELGIPKSNYAVKPEHKKMVLDALRERLNKKLGGVKGTSEKPSGEKIPKGEINLVSGSKEKGIEEPIKLEGPLGEEVPIELGKPLPKEKKSPEVTNEQLRIILDSFKEHPEKQKSFEKDMYPLLSEEQKKLYDEWKSKNHVKSVGLVEEGGESPKLLVDKLGRDKEGNIIHRNGEYFSRSGAEAMAKALRKRGEGDYYPKEVKKGKWALTAEKPPKESSSLMTPAKGGAKLLIEKSGKFYRSDEKPFKSEVAAKLVAKRAKREDLVPKKVKGGFVLVPGKAGAKPIFGEKIPKEEIESQGAEVQPVEEIKDVNDYRRNIAQRAKKVIKSKNPKSEEVDKLEDDVSRLINSRSPEDFAEDWEYDEFNELNNTLLDIVRKAREKVGGEPLEVIQTATPDVEDVLDLDPSNRESIDEYLRKHGGTITLDSMGLQQVYEKSVDALKKAPEAYDHLKRIARGVVYEGKTKFSDFKARMKEVLGEAYEKVKHLLLKAWREAKEWNKKLGERGFFGSVEGAKRLSNKAYSFLVDRLIMLDEMIGRAVTDHSITTKEMHKMSIERQRIRERLHEKYSSWEPAMLKEAKRMDREGKDMMDIFVKTGWFKGKTDKKWRFEIDDRKAKINRVKLGRDGGKYKLPDVLKLNKLYEAYPFLEDTRVVVDSSIDMSGYYDEGSNVIKINPNSADLDLTLLHETQHAIQGFERLPRGGSIDRTPGPKTTEKYRKMRFGEDYEEAKNLATKIGELRADIVEKERKAGLKPVFPGEEKQRIEIYRNTGLTKLAKDLEKLRRLKEAFTKMAEDHGMSYNQAMHELTYPPSSWSVYLDLVGEKEARDVETRHGLTNLRNAPPALLTERGIDVYEPSQVAEKVSDRMTKEDRRLTKKAIEKREEKLKATDLDLRDIVELARAKNFDANFVRARMKSKFGKTSLKDLTHDEADELKLNLAKEPPKQKNQVVEYVKGLKGIRDSAKKKFEWAARVYEVSEGDLAKLLSVAAERGKIDETAVNKTIRMIQATRELAPIVGEPPILTHLAPVKRIFGEDFMRVWRKHEVRRLEEMMPYVYKAVDIFHGLKNESLEAITKYREGELKASDLSPQELRVSKELDKIYKLLYKALEIDKQEIPKYSPRVRKEGPPDLINWVFSPKGMEEMDFWAKYVRTGELNPRELNAKKLLMRYIRTGFRAKYYNKAMEEAKPFFDKLDSERRTLARRWTDLSIRKMPTEYEKLANRAARKILRMAGKKVDSNSRLFKDLVGAWMDLNYSAFMGLRPKLALRNKLQEWLTFNEYGSDYVRGRLNAWSKEIDQALEKSDAFKLRKKDYLVVQEKINRLTDIPKDVREAMMFMYRAADLDNVRVAFASGYERAKRLGLPMEERIRAGEKAIHATQWGYGIDLPMLFQSTIGRAFGQYTSWPLWYFDHISRIVRERQGAKAARMFGQLVALLLLKEYGGIDYLRSFGLGVVPTRLGGYVPNQVFNFVRLLNAVGSGNTDRVEKVGKDIIKGTFLGLVPGYLAAKDIKKLLESKDWKEFLTYTAKKKKTGSLPRLGQ